MSDARRRMAAKKVTLREDEPFAPADDVMKTVLDSENQNPAINKEASNEASEKNNL